MNRRTAAAGVLALASVAASVGCTASRPPVAADSAGAVTTARVEAERDTGQNWLINGRYEQQHFSPLAQVNAANVGRLRLAWYADIPSAMGLAAEPIVVDGVIYLSAPMDRVYAIDAATGRTEWSFDPHVSLAHYRNSWAARANRGVAVWQGRVYVATGDCRLIALDAAKGTEAWQAPTCDPVETGSTGSPRVGDGNVYVGYNGSDTGVRGSVIAINAATGKQAWRFWTVPDHPGPQENAALGLAATTWQGKDWWKTGGGDVWTAITYDPATREVIFGTAGANPDELYGDHADLKPTGKKLFSGSIVALDAGTGKFLWYFQTSPDTENMQIVAADLTIGGQVRHVVMTVPKNGTFYVLDARTGKLISAKPLDPRIVPFPAAYGRKGGRPAAFHNWWPMSYSPRTGLVYVPANDARRRPQAGETANEGKLYAWDPVAQTARWSADEPLPDNSGVLSTAGNLVFAGQGTGEFDAYNAATGQKLWSQPTGSANDAVPVTYELRGEQYILVPVGYGSGSRLFDRGSNMGTPASKRGPARLLAFSLNGALPFPTPQVTIPAVPEPPPSRFTAADVKAGAALYQRFVCWDCHAPQADGSGAWTLNEAVPDLRYMPRGVHDRFLAIVMAGTDQANGMPCFGCAAGFPFVHTRMTAPEAMEIHDYLISLQRELYRRQHNVGLAPRVGTGN